MIQLAPIYHTFRLLLVIGLLVVTAFFLACATGLDRKNVRGAELEVDDIEFKGVNRFEDGELLSYLYLCEKSWIPFSEECFFNEAYVPLDTQRILELYKSYGYFNAEVVELRSTPEGGRSDEVDILIVIREGEPVLISRIAFEWREEPEPITGWGFNRDEIESMARLESNLSLEIVALHKAAGRMEQALRKKGYPFAAVEHRAIVDLQQRVAEVQFIVRVGLPAVVGDIRIVGLEAVPEDLVRREIDFAPESRFSPVIISRVEKAVMAMDVFAMVNVTTDQEVGEDGRIGITVTVSESEPQMIRIGVGFGVGIDSLGRATHGTVYPQQPLRTPNSLGFEAQGWIRRAAESFQYNRARTCGQVRATTA